MTFKIVVRPGEPIGSAIRRLKRKIGQELQRMKPVHRSSAFRWRYVTRAHFQKPSLLGRIRQARKLSRSKRKKRGRP